MLNPGSYSLGSVAIVGANVWTSDWIADLDGMKALSAQLDFIYGSGGQAKGVKAYLQTSFDAGATGVDIACVTFGQINKEVMFTLDGTATQTPVTPSDGLMADDTQQASFLGDRVRLKVISAGTAYAGNTMLSGWVSAK